LQEIAHQMKKHKRAREGWTGGGAKRPYLPSSKGGGGGGRGEGMRDERGRGEGRKKGRKGGRGEEGKKVERAYKQHTRELDAPKRQSKKRKKKEEKKRVYRTYLIEKGLAMSPIPWVIATLGEPSEKHNVLEEGGGFRRRGLPLSTLKKRGRFSRRDKRD